MSPPCRPLPVLLRFHGGDHACFDPYVPRYALHRSTGCLLLDSVVSTYPSDPQASSGLQKCMDILERMQRVWPSAFRANELLHGSRVHQRPTNIVVSPAPASERTKRIADALEEEDAAHSPRSATVHTYRGPQQQIFSEDGPAAPASAPAEQPNYIDLNMTPAENPSYYQSQYNRWAPAEHAIASIPSSLSTSVLPQQFSTGLVDDRMQRNQDRPSNRYPQYWSDYSALGQMDPAYAMPVMGDMVPQHSPTPQSDQPMYVSDQYSLYSESSSYGTFEDT